MYCDGFKRHIRRQNVWTPVSFLKESDDCEAVEWLLNDCQWSSSACQMRWISSVAGNAAKRGDLEIFRRLWPQYKLRYSSIMAQTAASTGNLELVQWLYENGAHFDERELDEAASCGHLEIVKWMHTNLPQCSCTTKAMDFAAESNFMHVLQWLHENRTEGCSTDAMDFAAKRGHLEMIQWLH